MEEITDSSFRDEISNSDIPVLVDFWAPWCGPCKSFGKILEDVVANYKGKVRFVKMNIDDNTDIPTKFGIRSIPTIIMFHNGQPLETQIGSFHDKEQLTEWIENCLARI